MTGPAEPARTVVLLAKAPVAGRVKTRLHSAFAPRDAALKARLMEVSPVISRQMTMWQAWIGFNASHSYGAILFGLVYGYLALLHSSFLFQSWFLLGLGLLALLAYAVLGKVYWFSTPFRGILLATTFYGLGLAAHFA